MKAAVHCLLSSLLTGHALSFAPPRHSRTPRQSVQLHSSSLESTAPSTDPQTGIPPFEEWFAASSSLGARISNIRHCMFHSDTLRGLEYTSKSSAGLNRVAVVPRSMVLSAPCGTADDDESWDVRLSCKLIRECKKGKDSAYYGYCALLTNGANLDPSYSGEYPSTAPDALRHWTSVQKSLLETSEKGKRLLKAEQQQREKWESKYDNLSEDEKRDISLQDFLWAMEAVHSRAFRGDFSGTLDGDSSSGQILRKLASLLLPLSALAFGFVYATDPGMNQYYVPCAVVAASPVVLNIIANRRATKEAVLLPLIDSANHLQEADSVIEYDPAVEGFVLSLGRKCLVREVEETTGEERAQVCISYGLRSDSELLVNYGFLRGVSLDKTKMVGSGDGGDRDEIRRMLAETYLNRNA